MTAAMERDAPDSYSRRQRDSDAEYARQYKAWVESLPPDQRSQLADLGLDSPDMPDTAGSRHRDVADTPLCAMPADEPPSHSWLPEENPPGSHSKPETNVGSDEDTLHLLRRLIGELLSQDRPGLSIECLALVTGLCYTGDSMTTIAHRHGVTRAAVSKRCISLSTALNLPPSRAMRSLPARDSYRQRRHHQLNHLDQPLPRP
jgi:hypothetical protein